MSTLVFSFCAEKPIEKQQAIKSEPIKDLSSYQKATFAGGCFWCVEGVFEQVKGIEAVISGYAGGNTENPDYESVSSGTTGHAESVEIYYDSTLVDYLSLVKLYFASMDDPTQVNGQGPDRGTQYRSIIFYRNSMQKKIAEDYIAELNNSGKFDKPISAEIKPFEKFWKAEDYHQDYVRNNPDNPYVRNQSLPRLWKAKKELPQFIK